PSGKQDRGREPRGGADRPRETGRERQRDGGEAERKRDRERDKERDRDRERDRGESGERSGERGERRRRRRSERGRAYDERPETPAADDITDSLLDEELAEIELEPTESPSADRDDSGETEAIDSERR